MTELGFTNLLGVVAIAFLAPLAATALGRFRVPAVVLELAAGILLGPAVLGVFEVDEAVGVLALVGLATLLFLAGLELEPMALRGHLMRVAVTGFALSIAIALLAGAGLQRLGVSESPVLIAIALSATSVGIVVPVLKDAELYDAPLGQLVVLGASVAGIASIVLLALLFSGESSSVGAQGLLICGLVLLGGAFLAAARGAEHIPQLAATLQQLQDTTAQIRVRGAFLLLIAFAAIAQWLGLEVILGAFIAGAALAVADPDRQMTHPDLRRKLEAVGYGVFIPVFFAASGMRFDVAALTQDAGAALRIPLFLAALLAARALPAILYRASLQNGRQVVAAGLLQATSLPFLVASAMIGLDLGLMSEADAAGLVAAGLLSVVLFPPLALALIGNPTDRRPVALLGRAEIEAQSASTKRTVVTR